MQANRKQIDIYLTVLAFFGLTAVTLRTLAAILQFDYSYGYYTGGNLITIANTICVAGVFALLSHFASYPKGLSFKASFSTPMTYIPTGLVSVALAFLAVSLISSVSAKSPYPLFSIMTLRSPTYFLSILSALLAILSIFHFFLNAFIKEPHDTARASASFITVIFLCAYPAYLYFNSSTPLNAPNKITDQMAYLSVAIFSLYESRISLGRERWRAYISFGLVAALLTAYSSIPSIITYFAKGEVISDSIAESVLTFALFIFVFFRLVLIRSLYSEEKAPVVSKIIEVQAAISAEIGDSDLVIAEPEQLSFDMFYDKDGASAKNEESIETDASSEVAEAEKADAAISEETQVGAGNEVPDNTENDTNEKQLSFDVPDEVSFELIDGEPLTSAEEKDLTDYEENIGN